ncbi:DUF4097 family beta strand repeat-containing protein [Streptomyces sp. B93]|uniref:DUF4097 family beta strand repeat-containing protein n=1 Tax=Streptomyces sp. B93 TaxID=2824875 RepID=UPI001B3916DA|nr:DUF4097 family beta strand repeat-containing protein [Streptomyces sp. B93]MBQ1090564.1 DUF4097 family beta strand repeat protein [Streptomyces sp. B93]
MQKFNTPAPISAVLNVPAGQLRLIAADRADTTVEVLPADALASRDVKAAAQVQVAYHDGVLRVDVPEPRKRLTGPSGSVEVTVQLPAGSRVEATSSRGVLRGVGRLGDLDFESAQATVKVDEAAGVRLALKDGAVTVGRLTGPAEISTLRGDLTVTEAAGGTLTLRTEQGDITVGAARGTSAALDAHTSYGRIHNSLKNDGTPGLAIHATTTQGDITARSL